MRAIRRLLSGLVVATAVWLALDPATAMSRMGSAEVFDKDGQPCFALPAREVARGPNVRVHSISVWRRSTGGVIKTWEVTLEPPQTPDSPSTCIVYGDADAKPAEELKAGPMYEVSFGGRSSDPSDSTQGYIAKFCLAVDVAGRQRVIPVEIGSRAWRDEICR